MIVLIIFLLKIYIISLTGNFVIYDQKGFICEKLNFFFKEVELFKK